MDAKVRGIFNVYVIMYMKWRMEKSFHVMMKRRSEFHSSLFFVKLICYNNSYEKDRKNNI